MPPFIVKPNIVPIDFKWNIGDSNPLQHIEPSFPKMPIVRDMKFCCRVIGCQKNM
jgi:hypothetical protein